MKTLIVIIIGLFVHRVFAAAGSSESLPDKCHFDHHLVTLSHDSYRSLQSYFSQPQNTQRIGTAWSDDTGNPSVTKGFLKFSDGTYLEIWDAGNMTAPGFLGDELGFQEACRVKAFNTVLHFAGQYGVGLVDTRPFTQFATVGRNGQVGDPDGGLFFIWYNFFPEKAESKFGIYQILKNVRPDHHGKPNARLISDYSAGGLSVSVQEKSLKAKDDIGRSRVVTADPTYPIGLIAIRFSRPEADTSDIEIPKATADSEQFSIQLRPSYGTLIFQPNAFKAKARLLDSVAMTK